MEYKNLPAAKRNEIDTRQAEADDAVMKIHRASVKMHEKLAKLSAELAIAVLHPELEMKADVIAEGLLRQLKEMAAQEG